MAYVLFAIGFTMKVFNNSNQYGIDNTKVEHNTNNETSNSKLIKNIKKVVNSPVVMVRKLFDRQISVSKVQRMDIQKNVNNIKHFTNKDIGKNSITHSYKFSDKNISAWSKDNLPKGCELVHAILSSKSNFYKTPAKELLNKWDVLSTSLVNLDEVKKQAADSKNLNASNKGETYTKLRNGLYEYCTIALVLDIPNQNILGTFDKDAWFPNNIGTEKGKVIDASKLSETFFSGEQALPQFNGEAKRVNFLDGGFNQIKKPHEIMEATKSYNEILVAGRPSLNIYNGLPSTKEIKIKAIYVGYNHMEYKDGKLLRPEGKFQDQLRENVEKLRQLNGYELPVIEPAGLISPAD